MRLENEKKEQEINDSSRKEKINKSRAYFLSILNELEKEYFQNFKLNYFLLERNRKNIDELKKKSDSFLKNENDNISLKITYQDAKKAYESLLVEIEDEFNALKKSLLNNKSIILKKLERQKRN